MKTRRLIPAYFKIFLDNILWLFLVTMILGQPALLFAQKVPIAVLDLDGIGISNTESATLSNRLRNELFKIGKFEVVDRSIMEDILREQDFQMTGCTSNDCLVEVGQLLGAKQMVGGSVSKIGGTFTISARLVDVETAKVLGVSDFDLKGKIDDMLIKGMRAVALTLSGQEIDQGTIASLLPPSSSRNTLTNEEFRRRYIQALTAYQNGQYREAEDRFAELVSGGSQHELADNAQYWLAECFYAVKNFKRAITEFERVFNYPTSDKGDDARYKIALSYWNVGSHDRARIEFRKLLDEYPNTDLGDKARRFLQSR